jgi:hypothetical protein
MPKTYLTAPPDAMKMLGEIIREHYPHIPMLQNPLSIGLRFVLADEDSPTPALTKGGWPCDALTTKVPTKMRAAGAPDVLIEVDLSAWHDLEDKGRVGLLHHELHHVELVDLKDEVDEDGEVSYTCRLDALERPVVNLRKHDYECGGFARIHEIYGEESPEARQLVHAHSRLEQQVFPFAKAV